jgi:hypothetical protein
VFSSLDPVTRRGPLARWQRGAERHLPSTVVWEPVRHEMAESHRHTGGYVTPAGYVMAARLVTRAMNHATEHRHAATPAGRTSNDRRATSPEANRYPTTTSCRQLSAESVRSPPDTERRIHAPTRER